MDLDASLAPKFLIFHYLIRWYIKSFGTIPYFLGIIAPIAALCIYTFGKNIRSGEWDRAIMIIILGFILVGGLMGLGMDINLILNQ